MSNSPRSQSDEPLSGHAFPLLYNVVYCSRATDGVDEAAVQRIIETSRRWNPAQGITGLLVFGKSEPIAATIRDQFAARKPERRYVAIVAGQIKQQCGEFHYYP